jgi:hypothetical protein
MRAVPPSRCTKRVMPWIMSGRTTETCFSARLDTSIPNYPMPISESDGDFRSDDSARQPKKHSIVLPSHRAVLSSAAGGTLLC